MTIGALSLVSQPSTIIWNAKTTTMLSQNCSRENTRVPDHRSSTTVASTATTASTVYSGTGVRAGAAAAHEAEHLPHRLVGEQAADRDDEEEDELFERHPQGQLDAGDVERVVGPVATPDADDVPHREGDHDRHHRGQEQGRPAIDARAEDELERQGDRDAGRHEEQVLVAIHAVPPR